MYNCGFQGLVFMYELTSLVYEHEKGGRHTEEKAFIYELSPPLTFFLNTKKSFAIICGVVHVDGRPECLSSSTDSLPSLKRLNHSNVLAWLKSSSPKASFSIRWVSAAVLLSFKQNLMQILCSLTSAILIFADTHANGVRENSQN